jgi:hypothetical protein
MNSAITIPVGTYIISVLEANGLLTHVTDYEHAIDYRLLEEREQIIASGSLSSVGITI